MKHLRSFVLLGLGLFLCEQAPAPVFMKLGDIKGEAAEKGHKEWIEILSCAGGEAEAGSGQATGRRQHKPIVITKPIDKASPALARAHKEGTVYPVIQFDVEGKSCTLLQAKIIGIETAQAMESISFNFEKITWHATPAKGRSNAAVPVPKRAAPRE